MSGEVRQGLGGVLSIKVGQAAVSGAVHRKALERPHRGAIRAFRQRREGWGLPCSSETESSGKGQASRTRP
ncbi:hypothetical protein SCMC78_72750 [Streptomyces sp. CMC78]|uniref:Uncharacterized protein n=1 Tax=Streptomyces sp. CMC78 TaxID=3231512 RepID=A0AB33KZK9_9ACTN